LSHGIIQQCFLEATAIVVKEMHVDQVVEGFTDILEELRVTPGAVIVEEQIR